MSIDAPRPEQSQAVEALWDLELLTREKGELDWDRLERLAEALAAEPGGWRRAVAVYEACRAKSHEQQDGAWLRVPMLLAAVGERVDEPGRQELAGFLIGAASSLDENEDFAHEALHDAIGSLGPAAVGPVSAALRACSPDRPEWFTLLSLLGLGAESSATASQRAVAIEAGESVLRRALEGEFSIGGCESAGWTLALLNHTPSIGLVEKAALAWESEKNSVGRQWIGRNELRDTLEVLRGKRKLESCYFEHTWDKGPKAWASKYWEQFQAYLVEEEREKQQAFVENLAFLTSRDPFGEMLSPTRDKSHNPYQNVSRNASCPCGSGNKYKNCCMA